MGAVTCYFIPSNQIENNIIFLLFYVLLQGFLSVLRFSSILLTFELP